MKKQTATLAAGCFWHVQKAFSKIPGIIKTRVGYTGGTLKNPNYKEVSSGKTGHAEAIEIEFDSEKITFEKILEIFWNIHNPTTLNRQGMDFGTNYRSAIFYHDEYQKDDAIRSRDKYQKKINNTIITEITKVSKFYPAEEYHQNYLEKNKQATCHI
ncbi:Peptide methionine sulfoxide reductase MsrA [uncultured archaeon]|nr:Peptide methionine sulfoxide reductase MsrA [uncultured archaeon]